MNFPFSRTFGAGTHLLGSNDVNVLVDTSLGAVNFILPNISALMTNLAKQGYSVGVVGIFPISITDISDNASVNNITIITDSADKFNGNTTTIVINQNNGSAIIKPVADTTWSATVSGSGGSGGGSSYELIGAITKDDVNANVGETSFTVGNFPYNNKVIVSVALKVTQEFDVDTISGGVEDLTNNTFISPLATSALNDIAVLSSSVVSDFIQTTGGAFGLKANKIGKGNIVGGNTVGNINVYVLFADIP